jgi:hypothetical protein
MALSIADILIVVFSLVLTFGIALWQSYRQKNEHSDDFFLSGKSVHWFLIGASLFASNIGTEHFIGQAGSAAASGTNGLVYCYLFVFLFLSNESHLMLRPCDRSVRVDCDCAAAAAGLGVRPCLHPVRRQHCAAVLRNALQQVGEVRMGADLCVI